MRYNFYDTCTKIKKIGKNEPDSLPCLCSPFDSMRRCLQEIYCRHLQNSDLTDVHELGCIGLASVFLASLTFVTIFIELNL